MDHHHLQIDAETLTYEDLESYLKHKAKISVTPQALDSIARCREYLDRKLESGDELFYGINTGFGFLQNVSIDKSQLTELQDNLLKSHACGVGDEVPQEIVRLMLMLKIKSLSYGHSGVCVDIVKRLSDFHNSDVLPVVYTKGSLGASGDLAPLSHLALPLIGEGEVNFRGKRLATPEVLKELNLQPLRLKSKEGLALINGTQFMSAYGMYSLIKSKKLLDWADMIAAISIDAFSCNTNFLNEHIHAVRPHKGQIAIAAHIREILAGSEICSTAKANLQDPYSFRCIPQVHGASRDTFDFVKRTLLTEVNSVTDNPNIFPEDDLIISGGNFHGQPLALSLDYLAIAMSEIGNISERRTYQLLSGQRNLPLFLIHNSGLNSGLMIPQYAAASLVSENKQLSTPASVDSISSSNNQEDHVSMGANAATKCLRVVQNVQGILAIELLTACQALDFTRPSKSSAKVEEVFAAFRREVAFNESDRILHDDIQKAISFIDNYEL